MRSALPPFTKAPPDCAWWCVGSSPMGHWPHCCMPSRTIHTQSIRRKGYRTNQQLPLRLTLVAQIKQLPGTNRSQIVKRPKLKFHLSIKHNASTKGKLWRIIHSRKKTLLAILKRLCALSSDPTAAKPLRDNQRLPTKPSLYYLKEV